MCRRTTLQILSVLLFLLAILPPAAAKIIYVDADSAGANNGTSWENAYNHLQDALTDASSYPQPTPQPIEIRIAAGIYKPDTNSVNPIGTGDRTATFRPADRLIIKGGYAGAGAADPNARDISKYETILSGDLNGDDVSVADPCELLNNPNRGDNSYHVVTAESCGSETILDGLTITAGNANGGWPSDNYNGGGIHLGSPTISHCKIIANSAIESGGGINFTRNYYSGYSGGGKIHNSIISNNAAPSAGGAYGPIEMSNCIISNNRATQYVGGGIEIYTGQHAKISDCTFLNNSAKFAGGAFAMFSCSPTLMRCKFVGNSSDCDGGAIFINGCDTCMVSYPNFFHCTIAGNLAKTTGGGIYNTGASESYFTNCIIVGNSAGDSGGAAFDATWWGSYAVSLINCTISQNASEHCGGLHSNNSNSTLTNSIIWGNISNEYSGESAQIFTEGVAEPYLNYCCIQDWTGNLGGRGNFDVDPCFAAPGDWISNGIWQDGDYHLKSQAGRFDPNTLNWVIDDVTSLCIDAGDPRSPIGYEPYPNGGRINIGAYGGTTEASKSYFGVPPCGVFLVGDLNGDCTVDFKDLAIMSLHWLDSYPPPQPPPKPDQTSL
jgi:predicted outer membrane repeat protein